MKKEQIPILVVYGKQPVLEALRSVHVMQKIIIAKEIDKKYAQKISSLAEKKNIEVTHEHKANLQKICGPVLHQGIVAIMDEFRYLNEKQLIDIITSTDNPLVLILDQMQDPQNLGAIIRTAEIAGVTAIVLPEKGTASVNATVAKTSVGAIFHSTIIRTNNLVDVIKMLQNEKLTILAMVPHREETIYNTDLKRSLGIIIGSEGKGVRKNIQTLCDGVISIPGRGKVDSLNASVATAVVLFEAVRQRKYSD